MARALQSDGRASQSQRHSVSEGASASRCGFRNKRVSVHPGERTKLGGDGAGSEGGRRSAHGDSLHLHEQLLDRASTARRVPCCAQPRGPDTFLSQTSLLWSCGGEKSLQRSGSCATWKDNWHPIRGGKQSTDQNGTSTKVAFKLSETRS